MTWLSNIADILYWHMADITAVVCLFLMFSPKLRIAAFISLIAALFAIGIEPITKEFTVMQAKTGEIVPMSFFVPALIDTLTAFIIVAGMRYSNKSDRFLKIVLESLVFILCAGAMVSASVIVQFPQSVYDNYTEIFFVVMLVYLITLIVGGTRDAVGCILDIYRELRAKPRGDVVYNIFLYGRDFNMAKMAAVS